MHSVHSVCVCDPCEDWLGGHHVAVEFGRVCSETICVC